MKQIFITFFSLLFLMSCTTTKNITSVKINNQTITAEIAASPQDRAKGLMNRKKLSKNHGMIFIFEQSDFHGFWMKNTLISLDIIWIDKNKKIIDIQTADPCFSEQCITYIPQKKAQYVLEVAKGTFEGNIGDSVAFSLTDLAE